MSQSEIV